MQENESLSLLRLKIKWAPHVQTLKPLNTNARTAMWEGFGLHALFGGLIQARAYLEAMQTLSGLSLNVCKKAQQPIFLLVLQIALQYISACIHTNITY